MNSVANILSRFYPSYLDNYTPSAQQAKTAKNIMQCKTKELGAHICKCESCGHQAIFYNS